MLLLLALLPVSHQIISPDQAKLCTENDGGDLWKYDLRPLNKSVYKIEDKKFTYHIALCGEQNIDVTDAMQGDAILQTEETGNHVVATKITNRHGGENWVNLVFGSGDNYNTHCNKTKRKAQLMFICDPTAGLGKPKILDEANDDVDFCFYMFEWPTNLVCPPNATVSRGGMSVFKLLLIEFVVIVVVYFVLGVAYNRYVIGARGYEQIPNLAFWKSCKEGAQATFDKCKGGGSGIGGIRSDVITTPATGSLNLNNDDDERLIM